MRAAITVIGEGELADRVCKHLNHAKYRVMRLTDVNEPMPAETRLALILHDCWRPAVHMQTEEALQASETAWLRSFVSFGQGVVGPLVRPGTPGCSRCADWRRMMAGRDRQDMLMLEQRLEELDSPGQDAWVSPSGLAQLALLVAGEAERFVEGRETPRTDGSQYLLHMKTLEGSWHSFLPNPHCPNCTSQPDDSPGRAMIELRPSPKAHPGTYRTRSMGELAKGLRQAYFDTRSGLINGKRTDFISPFADASVNLPLMVGDEATAGRSHSYADSELTAILEGLERYCGLAPRGKRTVVRGSYRELEGVALHPVSVGLHSEGQYALPDFPYRPFHPDNEMDWVWGYSFGQGRPILVPELLAYYSLGGGQGFVYETSNGCAIGGSLEEAIFYGIMEVAERDSFLMTWYARLPLPRLAPETAGDREVTLMIDRLQALTGYEVLLYNATMEHEIPCIWAMAKNRKTRGMNLLCAAGAHPDPVKAVKSALHELAGMMLTMERQWEASREHAVRMLRDSSLVKQMDDHSLLYGLPQAQKRLDFLLDEGRPTRAFAEQFKPRPNHADLTEDLKTLLETFRRLNLDVIVVDQTAPELVLNGLHCVKVIIPGMLPMTFGHHLTRLTGLERVLRVPMELGYVDRPLTNAELNPYPHPFP